MILVIDTCAEKLHSLEFTRPIEDILKKAGYKIVTKHYSAIRSQDLAYAEKIIICGTGLMDNKVSEDSSMFGWIKTIGKPLLGICAGMQLIGTAFGGRMKKKTEIGFYKEHFKSFLGLKDEESVYHLHNYYVSFDKKKFEFFSKEPIPQAVKHKTKEIYGVLFHPEVSQKQMILEFAKK